jgi:acyl-CoA reductase-like NAD-dependent aldehyde dehydrogenase
MNDIFSRIEVSHQEGRAQSVRLRQKLFHSLHSTIKASEKAIKRAIQADTGYSDHDVNIEYSLTISELRTHYESLDLRRELDSQKAVENLDATTSVGVVYIIPARGNLLYSVVSALTAALAAGNCIVLEVTFSHLTLLGLQGLCPDKER